MDRWLYICLLLLIAGCSKEEKPPFTIGSGFSYATAFTTFAERITKHDTLTFTIQEHDITSYSPGRKKIRWENTRHDYYQVRSMDADEKIIELQLPLNYNGFANEEVAAAGHLLIIPGAAPGDTLIKETPYNEAYGRLRGYTIIHRIQYLRDTAILFDGQELKCQLWESRNTNYVKVFGLYSVEYTYNTDYGFVTMNYNYADGKKINMQLVDIAIRGK
jgi:hypothetical protein